MRRRSSPAEIEAAQKRLLGHLRRDEEELRELIERQKRHAEIARRVGVKWADIAAAVGVPVTTAKNRFAGYAWVAATDKRRKRSVTVGQ